MAVPPRTAALLVEWLGAAVDPKVSANQRGHGIGVSLDVYTKSNIQQKGAAAKKLEDCIYRRKGVRMGRQKAS